MLTQIDELLQEKNIRTFKHTGIKICTVEDSNTGLTLAKELLYTSVDTKTALYLSGGNTPKPLYEALASEEQIQPGCVGMIDERYGHPLHERSNEKMIADTGLIRYLSILDIPFYGMLHGLSIEESAEEYDQVIRSLQTVYPKRVGLLGMGSDGHIAGIAPNRYDFQNPMFEQERQFDMISWFDDEKGQFKQRLTHTFLGLSMFDLLVLPFFGADKKAVFKKMFEPIPEEELPARFLLREDMAHHTLLITDQSVVE